MGDKLKEIPTQGALVRTDQLRECVFLRINTLCRMYYIKGLVCLKLQKL